MFNIDEIALVNKEVDDMRSLFSRAVAIIPNFDVLDSDILPYGLKPHTRSVSWLVEQAIVQQTKFNADALGIGDLIFELPDTSLHDCVVVGADGKHYYVNIKITSAGGRQNKNDIAAVEKLYTEYKANEDYRLIFVVLSFEFDNTTILFHRDNIFAFSAQFLPVYVNPRNDKIQADYHADKIERTRDEFTDLLETESRSIILK